MLVGGPDHARRLGRMQLTHQGKAVQARQLPDLPPDEGYENPGGRTAPRQLTLLGIS